MSKLPDRTRSFLRLYVTFKGQAISHERRRFASTTSPFHSLKLLRWGQTTKSSGSFSSSRRQNSLSVSHTFCSCLTDGDIPAPPAKKITHDQVCVSLLVRKRSESHGGGTTFWSLPHRRFLRFSNRWDSVGYGESAASTVWPGARLVSVGRRNGSLFSCAYVSSLAVKRASGGEMISIIFGEYAHSPITQVNAKKTISTGKYTCAFSSVRGP